MVNDNERIGWQVVPRLEWGVNKTANRDAYATITVDFQGTIIHIASHNQLRHTLTLINAIPELLPTAHRFATDSFSDRPANSYIPPFLPS